MNLSMQTVRPRKKGCPCTCQRVDGRKPNCTPVYAIPFISEACQSTPAWWFQAMQYNMFVDLGGPLMLNFDTYPFAICCFCSHIQPISSLSSRGESPFLARIPSLLLESSLIQKKSGAYTKLPTKSWWPFPNQKQTIPGSAGRSEFAQVLSPHYSTIQTPIWKWCSNVFPVTKWGYRYGVQQ